MDIFNAIGFRCRRPEKETGKGPDNLCQIQENAFLIIECKNEKTGEFIFKDDNEQLMDSISWFRNLYLDNCIVGIPVLIHKSRIFENHCSPTKDTRIINDEKLVYLKQRIKDFAIAYANAREQGCLR
jgi:predicted nucleic-acid-binding Zn-ribbon protein